MMFKLIAFFCALLLGGAYYYYYNYYDNLTGFTNQQDLSSAAPSLVMVDNTYYYYDNQGKLKYQLFSEHGIEKVNNGILKLNKVNLLAYATNENIWELNSLHAELDGAKIIFSGNVLIEGLLNDKETTLKTEQVTAEIAQEKFSSNKAVILQQANRSIFAEHGMSYDMKKEKIIFRKAKIIYLP